MTVTDISCAILAGGRSTRFGGISKAQATVGGKRIIDRIIGAAREIFEEVIIVAHNPEIVNEHSNLKLARDIFKGAGPPGGIHSALTTSRSDAVFIVAADMPFIDSDIIYQQIEFYRTFSEADAVIPKTEAGKEPLHGIYRKSILPLLEPMLQEEPGFSVFGFLDKVNTVYFNLPLSEKVKLSFFNINTPGDLAKAEEISAENGL